MFGPDDEFGEFARLVPSNAGVRRPPTGAPPVLRGEPKPVEPVKPEVSNLPPGWERGPDGAARPIAGLPSAFTDPKPTKGDQTPGDIEATAKARVDAVAQFIAAKSLYEKTKTMRAKFAAGPGRTSGFFDGMGDFVKRPENTAFDNAGNSARGDIKRALNISSGEGNTAGEQKTQYGSYLPDSWDFDSDAIGKMRLLDQTAYDAQKVAIAVLGGVPDEVGNITPLDIARERGMLLPTPEEWEARTTIVQPAVDIGDVARPSESEKAGTPLVIPKNPSGGGTTPGEAAGGVNVARSLGLGFGDVVQAAGDTFGLLANPLNAGINALTGSNLGTNLGQSARDAIGAPTPVGDSERFASAVNRGGVSALSLGGLARGAAGGVSALYQGARGQVVGGALSRFAPTPLRDAVAGSVAGGAADLTRQAGGGPVAQAGVGLLAGGTAAAGLTPGVARSLVSSRPASTAQSAPVIRAAVDEGIELPKVMVSGSRRDAVKAGMLEADASTATYAQNAFEGVNDRLGERASNLGAGGTARGRGDIGESTRTAAAFIRDADRMGYRSAYTAAEQVDGDPLVDLATMRTRLDRDIARLSTVPGGGDTVRELRRLRTGIEQPIPLSSVREMRTNLREGIDSADLTRSSALKRADARALAAVEGANRDIEGALSPQGLAAWRAADQQFAQAQTTIREALRPFVGKDFDQLPAEAIFDRLKGAANGNGQALAALHRRLPPRLSRDIAATFAEGLGKAAGDSGEPFSAIRFISDARKFSPSARQTLFGPSGATSIDNMLRISRRMRNVQSEINRSKTARPVRQKVGQMMTTMITMASGAGGALMTGGVGGGAMGMAAGIGVTAGVAQLQAMSARTLMNPRTTRWLESLLDVQTPGDARQAAARLAVIMDREPTIANDLQPYHDVLTREMTAPVAASEPDRERNGR